MEIKGRIKVFRDEHNGNNGTWYSYRGYIGNKGDDGTWDNDPYEIVLAKDVRNNVIGDRAIINITDGFLSCRSYIDKGGQKQIVSQIIVTAYSVTQDSKTQSGYTALSDADVPF